MPLGLAGTLKFQVNCAQLAAEDEIKELAFEAGTLRVRRNISSEVLAAEKKEYRIVKVGHLELEEISTVNSWLLEIKGLYLVMLGLSELEVSVAISP